MWLELGDVVAPIEEHVQAPRSIEESRIGVTVGIQIGPYEVAQPGHAPAPKGGIWLECPVAPIPQHHGCALDSGEHQVQVALHVQVGGPGTGVGATSHGWRDRLVGRVGEGAVPVLTEQAKSARTRQHEVHPEVVVVVEGSDGRWRERCGGRSSREGERLSLIWVR